MSNPTARLLSLALLAAPALATIGCSATETTEISSGSESSEVRANPRASAGPFLGKTLFVEPESNAADQADEWRNSDPEGAALMDIVAEIPITTWIGDWVSDPQDLVDDAMNRAGTQLQTFAVYNIPQRDCGNWSEGGVSDADEYADFVDSIAAGLDGREAIIILEPDALAVIDCLDSDEEADRKDMMADAVDALTVAGGKVYIDAGDSNWVPAADMAEQLLDAGVANAAGFALNVSHTEFEEDEAEYAAELRAILGDRAHYVIDTSRAGLGPSWDNEWCNPLERAHGAIPTTRLDNSGLDAKLWIKRPGESDGNCNGGPDAGHWWGEYAKDLAVNAGF